MPLVFQLLHPDAPPHRVLVIGNGSAASLIPSTRSTAGPADVVAIIPDLNEGRSNRWITRASLNARESMASDSLVVALGPPLFRARLARNLRQHGFSVTGSLLLLPNATEPNQLVPTSTAALRYALTALRTLPRPLSRLVKLLLANTSAAKLVSKLAPNVALIARYPASRPAMAWLDPPNAPPIEGDTAIVSLSWRNPTASAVVHRFSQASSFPTQVVKLGLDPPRRAAVDWENHQILSLGPSARDAGVRVPHVQRIVKKPGAIGLVQEPLSGTVAARLIGRGDLNPSAILEELGSWLARWTRDTTTVPSDGVTSWLDEMLETAAYLSRELKHGERYLGWLRERCAAPAVIPLVAAHNDLTMWNVIWDPGAPPGIVDWETASNAGLPTTDFVYAAVDARLAARRDGNRLAAFLSCFGSSSSNEQIGTLHHQIAEGVGMNIDAMELCFHAGWLQHALNESRTAPAVERGPFFEIVEWLATNPDVLTGQSRR